MQALRFLLQLLLLNVPKLSAAVAAPDLEGVLADVGAQVRQKFGNISVLIEALVCHADCGRQPMQSLADAGFMRAVYTPVNNTRPNIMAAINLTASPFTVKFAEHQEPFLQDDFTGPFPPRSNLTFESAFARLEAKLPTPKAIYQMTFRKPVNPCTTEDLYQFNVEGGNVMSIGVDSLNVCVGFITQKAKIKWCPPPVCITETKTMLI